MKELLISQVVTPVLEVILTLLIGIITYYAKQFYNKHKDFLALQREQIVQKIGIDKYNADIAVVTQAVKTVEQLGKEFDWQGELKHSKVLEMIESKTGLSDTDIYNIIKATVLEVNGMGSSPTKVVATK